MSPSRNPPPTEAELAILRVLWSPGPTAVRAVHEALGGDARMLVAYYRGHPRRSPWKNPHRIVSRWNVQVKELQETGEPATSP